MNSIAQELKQFAARITTAAGDVASVKGQSISEVLDYTFKNLNVDENGALVVSEIVEPVKPSVGGGNLLKAPATISPSDNQVILLDYSLNLEEGKSYKVIGTKGENNTAFEFTSIVVGNAPIEGGLGLIEEDGMAIFDKVIMDMETGDPIVSENNCVITTVADQIPLTITSVTLVEEASEPSVVNLVKEPFTTVPSTDTAWEIGYALGVEIGKSYRIQGSIDGNQFDVIGACIEGINGHPTLIVSDGENIASTDLECYIIDGVSFSAEGPVPSDNACTSTIGAFTINSITLVEEVSGGDGNLLQASVTAETNDAYIVLDHALGLEVGKSYIVSGTYGANNTEFSITTVCDGEELWGFAGLPVTIYEHYDGITSTHLTATVFDKAEFMSGYEEPVSYENKSTIYVEFEGDYTPVVITSITLVEESSEPSVDDGNLLSAPVDFTGAFDYDGNERWARANIGYCLNLEIDKQYRIHAILDDDSGMEHTFTTTAIGKSGILYGSYDTSAVLEEKPVSFSVVKDGVTQQWDLNFELFDKGYNDNGVPRPDDNNAMIRIITTDQDIQSAPLKAITGIYEL